jgi:8-oxo-dGTP diphosphatase
MTENHSNGLPFHIVTVMGIVTNGEGKILLVKSPDRGWEPPGGRVEQGEELLTALKREIEEESGIEVTTGRLLAVVSNLRSTGGLPPKVNLIFACTPTGGGLRTSSESLEVGWFTMVEAEAMATHPPTRFKLEIVQKAAERPIITSFSSNPFQIHNFEAV